MRFRQAHNEAEEKCSFRGCEAGFVGLRRLWVWLPQFSRGLLNTEKPKSIFGFLFHTILPYNGQESVTSNRTLDRSFVQDSVHFLSRLQITFIKTSCQWPRCTRIYWLRWSTESHVRAFRLSLPSSFEGRWVGARRMKAYTAPFCIFSVT